jgi:hydrogenase maturation protease
MVVDNVFAMVRTLGGSMPRRVLIVGCEPADFGEKIGLSEPVSRAIPNTIRAVFAIVQRRMASVSVSSAGETGTHKEA